MKLGIITDIHSNIIALNEVLKQFEKIEIDKIICCGDIIGIGPSLEEVVQALIQVSDKLIAVRGNHEKYLLDGLPVNVHDDKRNMSLEEIQNHKWIHSRISEQSKKFLENLPTYKTIEIENKKIFLIHYPMNKEGKYKEHIKNPTFEENKKMFSEVNSDIYVYGHTHVACINNRDNKWFINVGSLGCPLQSNIANAGVLDIKDDKINFEQLAIPYNVDKVIKEIRKLKFPFYEGILKIFYGDRN